MQPLFSFFFGFLPFFRKKPSIRLACRKNIGHAGRIDGF